MFDVSFSELLIIAVVALLVVGPERLPRVARTAGHLLGRLQRYVSDVKSDISREMQLDELKRLQQRVEDTARDMESSVNKEMSSVEESLTEAWTFRGERPAAPAATLLEREANTAAAGAEIAEAAAADLVGGASADTATQQLNLELDPQAQARRTT